MDDHALREFLLSQDVIYVGGGNTANLLAVWRVHGVDRLMREAYERGVLLCGISAGVNCWADGSHTDSFGPLTYLPDGLGVLPGSVCPHYDSEPGRRPSYQAAVASGALPGGWAVEDGVGVLFADGRVDEVVTRTEGARRTVSRPMGVVAYGSLPCRAGGSGRPAEPGLPAAPAGQ